MIHLTYNEQMDRSYRKVEALYRKGFDEESIQKACDIPLMMVWDIIQNIFAREQIVQKGFLPRENYNHYYGHRN